MKRFAQSASLVAACSLAACAVPAPAAPSFAAMPGAGKTIDQFRADDLRCRSYANQANGGTSPAQGAAQSAVGSAIVGTALGAAAGALLGAAGGAAGIGAAIGAGTGLLAGSAAGAGNAQISAVALQRNYDAVYAQCIAASGDKLPSAPTAMAVAYPYPYGYSYPPVVVGGFFYGYRPYYYYRPY